MGNRVQGLLSIFFIFLLFFFVIDYLFPVPCDRVLPYSIGVLDERFGVSHEELVAVTRLAEEAWELPAGKDLFTYDESASFTINLVYDARQERTDRARHINTSLDEVIQDREDIKRQYDRALVAYENKLKAYEANVDAYKNQARELQVDIQKSNAAGGASEEEYETFQKRQKELDAKKVSIEQEQKSLNAAVDGLNALTGNESTLVQKYNAEVETLNEEFGDDREFGQGVYTGDSITIYEFTTMQDLQLVLEHELGHALGIGHIPNPDSVMYYLMHEKNSVLDGPTKDDLAALTIECEKAPFQLFLERLRSAHPSLALP